MGEREALFASPHLTVAGRFVPLTAHEPRTLLPLLNMPLLDYTLEFLTAAGVQDIVVFCCAHAAKIQAHVARSKWAKMIETIVSQKCMSVGDALREIDQAGRIRHNFVLVSVCVRARFEGDWFIW